MNSDPGVIRFECPHCGAKLKTATSNAGKETDCSSCNVTLTIPQQLSELDVIFDPATGIASAKKDASEKKEHEFDIDFSFSDDIDDAIAQEREARKQQETPEAAPEIKEPAEQFQPRAKIVISDEDLPHKKRLRREIAQRKENSTESPETGDGEDSTPPIVFKDDDEDGEELLLQVDSIDAPNMEPVEVASPEHDTSPIRVEGLTDDLIDVDDLYGVKCEICDTRIHVTREQVGTTVDCPVCFSKVAVTPPKEPSKSRPEWMGPKPGFKKPEAASEPESDADDELKLSEPIERPKAEILLEPEQGLPNEEKDLLAPLPTQEDFDSPVELNAEDIPAMEIVEDPIVELGESKTNQSMELQPSPPDEVMQLQESDLVEDPEPVSESAETKPPPAARSKRQKKQPSLRERFERSMEEPEEERPVSVHTEEDLKPLTFKMLTDLVIKVVTDVRVIWRAAIAIALLTIGGYLFYMYKGTVGEEAEPGFAAAMSTVFYGLAYLFTYAAGTGWLWYICSFIFRDTARGMDRIEFKVKSIDEITSTFLLFAVSFLIAGAPFLMMASFVSAPIRLLIAPILLLVAWYNQSPYIGVSFEPFQTFKTEAGDWQHYYVYVIGLAFASLLAGLFFLVPYCEFIGATIMVFAALAYSAVTGWHIGRMIKKMDQD